LISIRHILFLTILSTSAIAQSPENYSSFSRTLAFEENFLDNENEWRTFYSKVKKGRYVVETIGKDEPVKTTITVNIDNSRNYDIETTVSMQWNRSGELMGFTWNTDSRNGYFVGFNKDQNLVIFKMSDGTINVLMNEKASPDIRPVFEENLITVRKYEEQIFIFMNKTLVGAFDNSIPYKDTFGYFTGRSSELRVTGLQIHYLGNP
jgi:hypothetical protein